MPRAASALNLDKTLGAEAVKWPVAIGEINAAIIAGNPPDSWVDRLRKFWVRATANRFWPYTSDAGFRHAKGDGSEAIMATLPNAAVFGLVAVPTKPVPRSGNLHHAQSC